MYESSYGTFICGEIVGQNVFFNFAMEMVNEK